MLQCAYCVHARGFALTAAWPRQLFNISGVAIRLLFVAASIFEKSSRRMIRSACRSLPGLRRVTLRSRRQRGDMRLSSFSAGLSERSLGREKENIYQHSMLMLYQTSPAPPIYRSRIAVNTIPNFAVHHSPVTRLGSGPTKSRLFAFAFSIGTSDKLRGRGWLAPRDRLP